VLSGSSCQVAERIETNTATCQRDGEISAYCLNEKRFHQVIFTKGYKTHDIFDSFDFLGPFLNKIKAVIFREGILPDLPIREFRYSCHT
jgi:hypothetical protein